MIIISYHKEITLGGRQEQIVVKYLKDGKLKTKRIKDVTNDPEFFFNLIEAFISIQEKNETAKKALE